MNTVIARNSTLPGSDQRLSQLIDELTDRLQSGEAIDISAFAAEHSDYADQLVRWHAAMQALVDLGASVSPGNSPATEPPDPARQRLGTLGDFRLVREIGRGGMGVVYEAEQISLGRRVALKVLPFAAVLDNRQHQRFKNEAQAAAILKHPHIVGVHCVGCERGVHFYAMELVEGYSLAEAIHQLRDGNSPKSSVQSPEPEGMDVTARSADRATTDTTPVAALSTEGDTNSPGYFRTVARLGIQAAEALEYAHQLGIVHRDIKPSNLMLEPAPGDGPDFRAAKMGLAPAPREHGDGKRVRHHLPGRPDGCSAQMVRDPFSQTTPHLWITDFGLAQVQSEGNLTMTGDVLGTLRYMSPEQASGRRAILDHRSDIYSLGITLYELATLQPAFGETDRARLLYDILEREPPAPRTLNSTAPKDLETIILKAIAKDSTARYDSAHDLADDLNRFLGQKPILARRSTKTERFWRWCRRNPTVASLSAAFLLALAVGLVATTSQWLRADRTSVALIEEVKANRRQLYTRSVHGAYDAWQAGNVGRVDMLLSSQIPAPGEEDLREFCWYHLWHLSQESKRNTVYAGQQPIHSLAVSPDGTRLAFGTDDGVITIKDLTTSRMRRIRGHTEHVTGLAFANDGTFFSASSDDTVRQWDVATGSAVGKPLQHDAGVTAITLSPNHALLVTGQRDGQVCVWELQSRKNLVTEPMHGQEVNCIAFSADGQFFATGSLGGKLVVWDALPPQDLRTFQAERLHVSAIAFSSDPAALIIGGPEGVKLLDPQTGTDLPGLRTFDVTVRALALVDAHILAVGNDRNTVGLWHVPSGYSVAHWPGHDDWITSLALAPGSDTLYSASRGGSVRSWNIAAEKRAAAAADNNDYMWVGGLDFSPDGSHVVAATRHQFEKPGETVEIVDRITGGVASAIDDANVGRRDCVAWSPIGPWVAKGGPGEVEILDASSGSQRLVVSDEPESYYAEVKWSADGNWLAAAGWTKSGDGRSPLLTIWRINDAANEAVEAYRHVESTIGSRSLIISLAFSQDGNRLACGVRFGVERSEVRLWQIEEEQWNRTETVCAQHTGHVCDVVFEGDELVISCGADRKIHVWSIAEERLLRSFTALGEVYDLAVSPDGRTLAAGMGRMIQFWDLKSEDELATVPALPWVVSIHFSPDGKTLAWKGSDKRVNFMRTE